VNRRIKEEFDNGRHYYDLHGQPVRVPQEAGQQPDPFALGWQNEHRFIG
jgi:putative restriction endonuclease